jgi:hypothetical protein
MKKRFEYKILDVKYNVWTGKFNEDEIVKQLNKEGMDGWEIADRLTYSTFNKIILKREI